VGIAVAAAWVLLLVYLIHGRPPDGAADPERLASAYRAAVAGKDEVGLERLLANPPGTAARALIEHDTCGALVSVRPMTESDRHFLELHADAGRSCGRLPIAELRGRWYVDPWADPIH
jgi:hypothetical protein